MFCRTAFQSAFSIFALHNNATAVENGDRIGINFPESRLFSSTVHIWNLVVLTLCMSYFGVTLLIKGRKGRERDHQSQPTITENSRPSPRIMC